MGIRDAARSFGNAFTGAQPASHAAQVGGLEGIFAKHTLNATNPVGKAFAVVGDVALAIPRALREGIVKPVTRVAFGGSVVVGAGAGAGALHIAKQPVVGIFKIGEKAVYAVRRHPIIAGGIAVAGALGFVAHRAQVSSERRTQDELMGQMMAAQRAPQPAYGLAPGEFTANVAPRMRDSMADGTPVAGGHADRYMEAKQAAAAAAPEAKTADLANL